MSDNEEISELIALAKAATPEWHAADRGIGWGLHRGPSPQKETWDCDDLNRGFRETFIEADARYIAACSPERMVRCWRGWWLSGMQH